MDFTFTEDQKTLADLAKKIFAQHCDDKGHREAEANGYFHERLWRALGDAGLLGLLVSAEDGGAALGLVELALLLEQQGRAAAPVPLVSSLVLAGLPLARYGSAAQKAQWLAPLAAGEHVLVGAFVEEDGGLPNHPCTRAEPVADGYEVTGEKTCVQAADRAARLVVPARLGDDVALLLVDPRAPGCTLEKQVSTTGEPVFRVTLRGVKVPAADVLVGPAEGPGGRPEGQADGRAAVAFVTLRAQAALSALALGLAGKQIEMVSEYVIRRSQFGKPIGLFQAVAQRAANAYIDAEAMRLSLWQAVWRLEENLPAEQPVAVARYWSAEGGHRIASTAQHLHGGMGFDKNYPLARYYLLAKQTEVTLGGASPQLERLGALISVQGAQPA